MIGLHEVTQERPLLSARVKAVAAGIKRSFASSIFRISRRGHLEYKLYGNSRESSWMEIYDIDNRRWNEYATHYSMYYEGLIAI